MKKIKKITIALFFSLLLLELGLQLWANIQNQHSSFQHFRKKLNPWPESFQTENTIIIIGDSTVYGVGSSDASRYSFPARLQLLLKPLLPNIQVLNIGYPATNSEEHLQLMEMVPDNSFVILRSGCSNLWNVRGGGFVCRIGDFFIEIRILRMLTMLFPATQTKISLRNRELRAFKAFEEIAQRKKLQLYYFDYAYSHPHFKGLFNKHKHFIPNFSIMEKAGLITNGEPAKAFINPDKHPSDAGYELEAIIIFNYLCQKKLHGLNPSLSLPVAVGSDFIKELKQRYKQIKNKLKNSEVLWLTNPAEIRNIYALLTQIVSLSSTEPIYQKELSAIEKIIMFAYHDISLMVDKLYTGMGRSGEQMRKNLSAAEILNYRRYYRLLTGFINIGQGTPKEIHKNLLERMKKGFSSILTSEDYNFPRFVPFITQPFPLEFCPRYINRGGFSKEELSLQNEWKLFFGAPYSQQIFGPTPPICQEN